MGYSGTQFIGVGDCVRAIPLITELLNSKVKVAAMEVYFPDLKLGNIPATDVREMSTESLTSVLAVLFEGQLCFISLCTSDNVRLIFHYNKRHSVNNFYLHFILVIS